MLTLTHKQYYGSSGCGLQQTCRTMSAADPTSRTLQLDDGRLLHYTVFGVNLDSQEQPTHTLLYHHGWPSCRLEAAALHAHALMLRMRVIAADRPGVGASSHNPHGTFSSAVHDAEQLLDALHTDTAIAIGTSGGGPYAAACAALSPRFSALALVASMTHASGPGSAALCRGMHWSNRLGYSLIANAPLAVKVGLLAARPLMLAAPLLAQLPLAVSAGYLLGSWGLPEGDRVLLKGNGPPIVAQLAPQLLQGSVAQGVDGLLHDMRLTTQPWGFDLGHIKVPCFLWQGTADVHVPVTMGQYLEQQMPNCKVHFVRGKSHGSLFVDCMPEVLAEIAREVPAAQPRI